MRHISNEDILLAENRYRTQLINSLTGYKSLGLIGTVDKSGLTNLALFSQIIHIGANPPYIGLLSRPNVVKRDTMENILHTGCFTINHVKESFYKQAHMTSARWQESEFEAVGLHEQYLDDFPAPYVDESEIKIGCELNEFIDIKSNGTHLMIGEIKHIYLKEEVLGEDGFIDLEQAGSLTVSGLDSYHRTEKIERLPYAKPIPQKEFSKA